MSEPLTDSHLAAVLVRGPRPTRVELVGYDPAWADRYAVRAAELRTALGPRVLLLEHVGSTAVPGLVAKPIIDLILAVDDPDDEPAYLPALEGIGYDVRVREPGHRCLRAGEPDERVNLHVRRPDDPEIRRHLVFRDRLRSDDADRELYAATKRGLTDREWPDINYYAEAKSPVIAQILRRAGWSG